MMKTVNKAMARNVVKFIKCIANLWFDGDVYAALDGLISYVEQEKKAA